MLRDGGGEKGVGYGERSRHVTLESSQTSRFAAPVPISLQLLFIHINHYIFRSAFTSCSNQVS